MNCHRVSFQVFAEGSPQLKYDVKAKVGATLLDTFNDLNIQDLSVFGICDKQLACHSCRVNFVSSLESLKAPAEDEKDVLDDLGKLYRPK